jgi:hypothetical protein
MSNTQHAQPVSKITDAARRRMEKKTAQEQLMAVLRELRDPDDVPDADDSSVSREALR